MDIKRFIGRNKYLLILFLLSTGFFVYQHYINLGWDFSVYSLNAKYWFANGEYFELMRPPLVPLFFGALSIFGWEASEYLLIIIVSLIFLYSSVRLAKAISLNKEIFYFISISPYLVMYGFLGGSELLSLALFELFLAFFLEGRVSGHFLALACLARYNFFLFIPLLFFARGKKIVFNLLVFLIVFSPWLAYNLVTTGNMLSSIADLYSLNTLFSKDVSEPLSIWDFMFLFGFLFPFFILGIGYFFYNFRETKGKGLWDFLKKERVGIVMLIILFLNFYQFITMPIKVTRYLFPSVLPVAYFSSIFLDKIKERKIFNWALGFLIVGNVFLLFYMNGLYVYSSKEKYFGAVETLEELNASRCRLVSDAWPLMSYLGKTSEPMVWDQLIEERISKGYFALYFYREDNAFENYLVYRGNGFFLLGNASRCADSMAVKWSYLKGLNETLSFVYNKSININPCFILFRGGLMERGCNFVNLNGFRLDENRDVWK